MEVVRTGVRVQSWEKEKKWKAGKGRQGRAGQGRASTARFE